jgi:hypothetical protein
LVGRQWLWGEERDGEEVRERKINDAKKEEITNRGENGGGAEI